MLTPNEKSVNMLDVTSPPDLMASIALFYQAYRTYTSGSDALLAQRGLGRVHHRVLYYVARHPELTVSELLERLGVSKQALHAPLRQLVELGLVTVSKPAHDRRVRQLALTAAGQQLEWQLTSPLAEHLSAALERAGPQATAGWLKVMHEISTQPVTPLDATLAAQSRP